MLSAGAPIRVQMEDISKSFGAIKSLDRVNLVLRAGEVLGLVGDNGAGKSTLSKILSGAVVPDTGRLLLDGREVRVGDRADQGVGQEIIELNSPGAAARVERAE